MAESNTGHNFIFFIFLFYFCFRFFWAEKVRTRGPYSNFNPPSLLPPFSFFFPSILHKPSLTLPLSSSFILRRREKGEREKDKRGKGEEGECEGGRVREGLYRGEGRVREGGSKEEQGPRARTLPARKIRKSRKKKKKNKTNFFFFF